MVGCLAHGGLGWIYLARDHNVSDRYVVLKGLLNTGDTDAYDAAVAEQQFLAEVQHPLIVEIYNFVTASTAAATSSWSTSAGKSLKQILKDRMAANGGTFDPFPVDQAIAYLVEILPAFSYLHALGLLYCDFKPDNVIQAGDTPEADRPRRRAPDRRRRRRRSTAPSGSRHPRCRRAAPSIASDMFTVARTLAVLVFEFRGYQTTYVDALPPPDDVPLFAEHDSLYRLLLKGTAPRPDDRFQSVDEMRDQLLGVLREVTSRASGSVTRSTPSHLFETPAVAGDELVWSDLPRLPTERRRPDGGLAGRRHRRGPGRAPRRRTTGRPSSRARCASPGLRRAGAAPAGHRRGRRRRGARRRSVGVAGVWMTGLVGAAANNAGARGERVQRRVRAGAR